MDESALICSALSPHCPDAGEMRAFVAENPWIGEMIARRRDNPLYREPGILAFAWMVKHRKHTLRECFPLPLKILYAMAADFGESYMEA